MMKYKKNLHKKLHCSVHKKNTVVYAKNYTVV